MKDQIARSMSAHDVARRVLTLVWDIRWYTRFLGHLKTTRTCFSAYFFILFLGMWSFETVCSRNLFRYEWRVIIQTKTGFVEPVIWVICRAADFSCTLLLAVCSAPTSSSFTLTAYSYSLIIVFVTIIPFLRKLCAFQQVMLDLDCKRFCLTVILNLHCNDFIGYLQYSWVIFIQY